MIRMPPRHGKSELASRNFPAYCIGRKPWRQFIAASATADLAREFGREVRNIIGTEAYQAVYSTRLAQDFEAANKWNTSEGGSWYSVGVGSDILGRRPGFHLTEKSPGGGGLTIQIYPSSESQRPSATAATTCGCCADNLPGSHRTLKSPGTGGFTTQT